MSVQVGPPLNIPVVVLGPPTQVDPVVIGGVSTISPVSVGPATVGVPTRTIFEGGDMYLEQDFTSSAQWHVVHGLGVIPGVTVYDSTGDEVIADVQADSTSVTVTFPGPTTGKLVLS